MSKITLTGPELKIPLYDVDKGDFDIVYNYAWTVTPPSQRYGVPYIQLVEYEQDIATLYAQLLYWYSNVKDMAQGNFVSSENPYANLYHAKRTGIVFTLPYFQEYDHFINQTWEKTKGLMDYPIADRILNLARQAAQILQLAPGTSVNQPQIWSGSGLADYNIRFVLFNTIQNGTKMYSEDITKNLRFKRRLMMSTLHDQRTAILASPPAIFSVLIPGVRYCPAAVIQQLSISNLGQLNMIATDQGEEVIPDAYLFDIRIQELITESRQILDDAVKTFGSKIVATTDKDMSLKQTLNGVFQKNTNKPQSVDQVEKAVA
jgi:hypothetical protein